MNSDNEKPPVLTYEEQLATLESRLRGTGEDEAMLAELGVAMRALLSDSGQNEAEIRNTLQKQYASGNLRQETVELVQNLLAKIASEENSAAPSSDAAAFVDEVFAAEEESESDFVTTEVIEDQAETQAQSRPEPPPIPEVVTELQVGSVLRDRFLLKERVSEGSMGIVYKALDRRLAEAGEEECSVAIKVLTPQLSRQGTALRALQQEAAKGRCLTHPNIVRFIDLDREKDLYFIVMEWLDGRSLAKILNGNGSNTLDIATALDIVRQLAMALDYAHQRGVIHADVKPGNVIITPNNEVKLIDFGVARVRQKENEGKSHFDPGVLSVGTPAYSSMQVLTGEEPVVADDVFSLACLFYRLVSGHRVYGPRNAAQAAESGMEPQRPQQLSPALWQPIKKALSYSRVTRYGSTTELVAALNKAAGTLARESSASQVTDSPAAAISGNHAPVSPVDRAAEMLASSVPDSASENPAPVAQPDGDPEVPAPVAQPESGPSRHAVLDDTDVLPNELPQPRRDNVGSIRAVADPIMFHEDEDEPRRSYWGVAVFALVAAGLGFIATQTDLVDQIGAAVETMDVTPITDVFDTPPEIIDAPPIDEAAQEIAEYEGIGSADEVPIAGNADDLIEAVPEELTVDDEIGLTDEAPATDETDTEAVAADAVEDVAPVVVEERIDWSQLPPATMTVDLGSSSSATQSSRLAIREDGEPAIIDFIREDVSQAMSVVVFEAEFSGNRSPLDSGQYVLENDGNVRFPVGHERARLTISMRSNPVRESDRDVSLAVREVDNAGTTLATIEMTLEDDDQRSFEDGLPRNTFAFAVNQISVRESDPAAQIDVIRYRPDDSSVEVSYELVDVTASEGQDYFAPDLPVVSFGPGQRTARILIPLGQDARPEADEAFMLEIDSGAPAGADVFSQIAVMIRDDDQ